MSLKDDAKLAIKEERFTDAAQILCKLIDTDFDDSESLFLLGYVLLKEDSIGLSAVVSQRAGELAPNNAAIWHNIGKCHHERQRYEEADQFFRRAIKVQANFPPSLEGLGMSCVNRGEFEQAIAYSNRSLAESPDATEARVNRGMAYLALKRWREGWRDFDANLGREKNRKELVYTDTPRWDGTKGLDVVCYGEQGLGDEISFASCLPDLIRDCKSVTIETDRRLEGLFKRSFPTCKVEGTRYKEPEWRKTARFDAKVALGQLPMYYRLKDADFHGKPYLVARPEMAMQWRTLLDSMGDKPKIGLSWVGGLPRTGQARRSVTLDTLAPLFRGFDADWISLQYKEEEDGIKEAQDKYGIQIHHWDWGVQARDYDQTVALISQLDLVISVCTTVVHAAGGLGKECWCLVPEVPMWRYMASGEWFPWASSVSLWRQKKKQWPIHLLLGKLKDKFGDRPVNRHSGCEKAAA